MNKEKLLKAMGDIDPAFVREAEPGNKRRSALSWALPMAAAFVLVLGLALVLPRVLNRAESDERSASIHPTEAPGTVSTEAPAVDVAGNGGVTAGGVKGAPTETPGGLTPKDADWQPNEADHALVARYLAAEAEDLTTGADEKEAVRAAREKSPDMKDFASKLTAELLRENPDSNTVFSPANIYIALSMVAETANGETQMEILDLLGAESMEALRESTRELILGQSRDDEYVRCTFADSLWLNNAYGFQTETLERLTKDHGASAFWGDPADEDFTLALRAWLNEQTGGLLDRYANEVELDPDTLLAIASTVYFKCSWSDKYDEADTQERAFHAKDGDITCDFMTKQPTNLSVHAGDGFTALGDRLCEGAGRVWFLLPDEGVSIEEMLARGGMGFMLSEKPRPDWKTDFITSDVILTVPKLDISSRNDLIPALKELGVTSCFDPSKADFSPLTGEKGPFIGKIEHSARICADEDGVEAAAYTLVQYYYGLPIEPETEYVLDRPFVLMIEGPAGAPLFIGIVNTPNN